MEQPEGFIQPGDEDKVCLLKKNLDGLKQSSRQWYRTFDDYVRRIGFRKSLYDNCVYIKEMNGKAVAHLLLYVDDMLIAGPCAREIQQIKDELQVAFEMKDLGSAKRILGMDIIRKRETRKLWLVQNEYIRKLVDRYQMENTKPVSIPIAQHFKLSMEQKPKDADERREISKILYSNIVGSIMYTMVCTRPDLSHAIGVVSRYMSDHGRNHWQALKWMLRYLKGSGNLGIRFKGGTQCNSDVLVGYCDSNYVANIDNRKSQFGYIFNLYGSAISWKSSL